MAIAITVFGALFIGPIVSLFGATASVAPYAIAYGRIIFLGALTSTGYSAIIRADGNIRYSTAMWIIPVSANIILCWLFIIVLHLGVSGAALATVLGQAISAGMSVYFFFFRKHRSYQLKASYFKPDWAIMAQVISIGFPSFVTSISASLIVIVTNNLLRLIGGDSALAVFAIVNRLTSALNTPQTGITQGMQPIVGYNFGRKRWGRVRKTITAALGTAVVYGVLVCSLCLLMPTTLLALLSKEPVIIAEGQGALRLLALACPLVGMPVLAAAYFQAVGRAKEALLITIGGILLVKLPVLLLAARLFSLTGIWAAEAASDCMLCIIALLLLWRYQEKMSPMERLASSP